MTEPTWIDAGADGDLEPGDARAVRADGKRIAMFRTADGELFAVDDRCPHEGYPLAKGELTGCVLTCKWHNFKFDIRDGACLMGDEPVRTFPIRVRGDRIELDVADPPIEETAARLWRSLERGMLERKMGQVARDVVRLLTLGIAPATLALFAARFDARYAEWGTTHVMPVALDVIAEAERRGEAEASAAALPLMGVFELAADSHTRRSPRPTTAAIDPGADPIAAGARLAALIEGEDAAAAEALLRGALARGWRRAEIEPWLFEAVCAHFLDFGHALIYQIKLFDLLERCDFEGAEELLVAHLLGIINGTREDTLPEWSYFRAAWDELEPRAADLYQRARESDNHQPGDALTDALTSGERRVALDALTGALEEGLSLRGAVNAISRVACRRILRFDVAIDRAVDNQHGWLDVTHTLTYANALRRAIERTDNPRLLWALYAGARFVNVTRALDTGDTGDGGDGGDPGARRSDNDDEPTWSRVFALAAARDDRATLAAASRLLGDGLPLARAWDFVLSDPVVRPIVCAHHIKLLVAACEEREALDDVAPVLAALRVLAAPIRERAIGRLTHEAIRLVVDGRVPRTFF